MLFMDTFNSQKENYSGLERISISMKRARDHGNLQGGFLRQIFKTQTIRSKYGPHPSFAHLICCPASADEV